jgi:hypothetical protein
MFGVLLVDISTPVASPNCFRISPTAAFLKRNDHVCFDNSEAWDTLQKKIIEEEHRAKIRKHRRAFKRLEDVRMETRFFTGQLLSQD